MWWPAQAKRQRRAAAKSPELPMTAAEREAELRRREALRDQHKLIYRALYSAGEGALPLPCSLMLVSDSKSGLSSSCALWPIESLATPNSTHLLSVWLCEVSALEEADLAIYIHCHSQAALSPSLLLPVCETCLKHQSHTVLTGLSKWSGGTIEGS